MNDLIDLILRTRSPRRTEPEAGLRHWLGQALAGSVESKQLGDRAGWALLSPVDQPLGRFQQVIVGVDGADSSALQWLGNELQSLESAFEARPHIVLDVGSTGLLRHLPPRWGVHTVELEGHVERALEALTSHAIPSRLRVRPLRADDVASIVRERRVVFSTDGRHPRVDDVQQQQIDADITARFLARAEYKVPAFFVFEDDEGRVAHAGFDRSRGGGANVDLFVSSRAQGRGLSKVAYKYLLREAQEQGCTSWMGQSSHPRVLGMALRMGRWARVWKVGFDRPFINKDVLAPFRAEYDG